MCWLRLIALNGAVFFFVLAKAQEGNNWVFEEGWGIDFGRQKDSMLFRAGSNTHYSSNPQSISNCQGKLMLYTAKDLLWNGKHERLKDTLREWFTQSHSLILPKPKDDSVFYYIVPGISPKKPPYNVGGFNYYIVNLRWDSLRGNVDTNFVHHSDSGGGALGFTKHANGKDYWLAFITSDSTFSSYLLTDSGFSKHCVTSKIYGNWGNGSANNPTIRFSNNGKMMIPPTWTGSGNDRAYLYNFDNSTGKCSNPRLIMSYYPKSGNDGTYGFSFSPNDSLIYTQFENYVNAPSFKIIQFQTYSSNIPKSSDTVFYRNNWQFGFSIGMQLAPDNRLYFYGSDSGKIGGHGMSYISYPDRRGSACDVRIDGLNLYPMVTADILGGHTFPCFSFPIKRIANKFNVSGADGCGYDTARFTFDGDSAFTYFRWYFGDGDSADGRSVLHQYAQPGSYYVRLACTLGPCGYRQWVGDSVHIKFKPNVSIVPTSTYTCGKNELKLDISYRYADTLHFVTLNSFQGLPSTGSSLDTTFVVTNSPTASSFNQTYIWQIQIPASAGMTVADTFAVRVSNSQCSDSISYIHNVNIDPSAKPVFQTNNPASCGSSTFTFSDTSGLDTVVAKRAWHIKQTLKPVQGDGYDSILYTSQNTLNITLQDTGDYTITLTQTTRQGCIDSLTKKDFVRVNPLPDATVKSDKKIPLCAGDSAILSVDDGTVIPANAGISKYKWTNGDSTATITVKKPGSFAVQIWSKANCYATGKALAIGFLPTLNVFIKKTADSLIAKPSRAVASYEWRNSLQSIVSSQPYLYRADSGSYSVTVTDSNGCVATSTAMVYKYIGIAPSPLERDGVRPLTVYPNPANTRVTIESEKELAKANIKIINITGQVVFEKANISGKQHTFDISQLASGIYFVEVQQADAVHRTKLVKE